MNEQSPGDLAALALLTEPVRRRLFDHVVDRHPHPVSRDEAAEVAQVSRNLAAFHLDRLVEAGLLVAGYGRLGGRSGPGAGRPSKLYRKAPSEMRVSLPERRYDFAAEILARAAEERDTRRRVEEEARRTGLELGRARVAGQGNEATELVAVLSAQGFDPVSDGGVVRLRNCPFHKLAVEHDQLVCGMNLALIEGIAAGVGAAVTPRLDRQPGYCCVVFDLAPTAAAPTSRTPPRLRRWARLGRRGD